MRSLRRKPSTDEQNVVASDDDKATWRAPEMMSRSTMMKDGFFSQKTKSKSDFRKSRTDSEMSIECDSVSPDHNSSPEQSETLCSLILDRSWDAAKVRLAMKPNGVNEATIESAMPGLPSNQCSGMPLHIACTLRPLPPISFISALAQANPSALRLRQSVWGFLPIHLVCDLSYKNLSILQGDTESSNTCTEVIDDDECIEAANHAEVVQFLLEAYPESIFARDKLNGMLPLHIAASTVISENYNVSPMALLVFEILVEASPECKKMEDDYGDIPVNLAWRNARFRCSNCKMYGHTPCWCHDADRVSQFVHPLLDGYIPLSDDANYDVIKSPEKHIEDRDDTQIEKEDIQERDKTLPLESCTKLTSNRGKGRIKNLSIRIRRPKSRSFKKKGLGMLFCNGPSLNVNQSLSAPVDPMKIKHSSSNGSGSHKDHAVSLSSAPAGPFRKLKIQIRLCEAMMSRGNKNEIPPLNPYFEMMVSDGASTNSHYKSSPLMNARGGCWEEVVLNIRPSRDVKSDAAIQSAKSILEWKICFQVKHWNGNGGGDVHIGACVANLNELCKQPLQPLLKNNKRNGWLEILSMSVVQ